MAENDILNKAASTGSIVSGGIGGVTQPVAGDLGVYGATTNDGGILSPEQSRQFIEYIFEQQVLARDGRRVTMRLDWEVSTEALEDNLEGAGLEDHLVRVMTRAFANDLEDLAINGTGTGSNTFLNILEGFTTKENLGASATYGTDIEDLQALVLAMPRKYRASRANMKFYADTETVSNIINGLGSSGNLNSERIVERVIGGTEPQVVGAPIAYRVLGLPLLEVPLMPANRVVLTFPENRIWGFQRDITVHREFQPKKDTVEYTVFLRFGVQIEETSAVAYLFINDIII